MVENNAGGKDPMSMDMHGTRLLKAHIDAAEEALESARAVLVAGGNRREAAQIVAESVITATDNRKTWYCVLVRSQVTGVITAFGPYASKKAAVKAATTGLAGMHNHEVQGSVVPLSPAPKRGRVFTISPEEGNSQ